MSIPSIWISTLIFDLQGLANILGTFIGVFQCSAFFDQVSIGKIVQGMAMVCIMKFSLLI